MNVLNDNSCSWLSDLPQRSGIKILKISKNLKLTDQKTAIIKTYKWYINNKIGKLI